MTEQAIAQDIMARIRRLSRPLTPLPTGYPPQVSVLDDVRAVIFDIYGTLLISGTGDIGPARDYQDERAMREALQAAGLPVPVLPAGAGMTAHLGRVFHAAQECRRRDGTEYPEVDILEVWRQWLAEMAPYGMPRNPSTEQVYALAIEYECRDNPVWPMPGLAETLAGLRRRGKLLGIVSNAQFYTPFIFPALLQGTLEDLGFSLDLCAWSYKILEGKPSTRLFQQVKKRVAVAHGVRPEQTLYIGNDRLKDIWPAARLGWKTALFAGDARSLRPREDDPKCKGVEPDLVISELGQLLVAVQTADQECETAD